MPKYISGFVITVCTFLVFHPLLAEDNSVPVQVSLYESGITVQTAEGVSLLEFRIAGPDRRVLFEQSSEGSDIYWSLGGNEKDGEYRYEAVVLIETNGIVQQQSSNSGFLISGGIVVNPSIHEDSIFNSDD